MSLCVSPYCGLPRQHHSDCDGTGHYGGECRGCLPAAAMDGVYLCKLCVLRLRHDAWTGAYRYRALGLVLSRSGAGGEKTSGRALHDLALNDAAAEARESIRHTLITIVRMIAEERAIGLPPATVVGLARFIGTHTRWLAGHRAADEHARDLRDIATDPRTYRIAFPSSHDRLFIGECPLEVDGQPCGTALYQLPDEPLVACRGCKTVDTIEQWQRWIAGDVTAEVDAYAAAAYLAVRWHRPVDPATVRKWGQRTATTGVAPIAVPHAYRVDETVAKRDERGRALYVLEHLLTYARRTWGEPWDERRLA